jgi:hypothetical protein
MSEGKPQTPIQSDSLGKTLVFMDLHTTQPSAANAVTSKSF